jgi:hypothetical protein
VARGSHRGSKNFTQIPLLDVDPQTVPSLQIKDVPIFATVLGGKVVLVSDSKKPKK